MAKNSINLGLPDGFVLDSQQVNNTDQITKNVSSVLPNGFVLDQTRQEPKSLLHNMAIRGPGTGRGAQAVEEGATVKDLPRVLSDAASSIYGNVAQQITQKPIQTSIAGLVGTGGGKQEEKQLPYPKYATEAGERLGEDIEKAGYALMGTQLASAAKPIVKSGAKVAKEFLIKNKYKTPQAILEKAKKLTTELLNPPKSDMASYYQKMYDYPATDEAVKIISKAKSYKDLKIKIANKAQENMIKRNKLIMQDNYEVGAEYLEPLIQQIQKTRFDGVTKPSEVQQMVGVLKRQIEFLKARGGKITRMQAQKLKEGIDKNITKVLDDVGKGKTIVSKPYEDQALSTVRKSLRDIVQGGNPEIELLDNTYGGLKRAKELLAGQEALAQKAPELGILDNIPLIRDILVSYYRPTNIGTVAARGAAATKRALPKQSKKIEDLMNVYRKMVTEKPLDYSRMRTGAKVTGKLTTSYETPTQVMDTKKAALPIPATSYGKDFTMSPSTPDAQNLARFRSQFEIVPRNIRSSQRGSVSDEIADILNRYYQRNQLKQ